MNGDEKEHVVTPAEVEQITQTEHEIADNNPHVEKSEPAAPSNGKDHR